MLKADHSFKFCHNVKMYIFVYLLLFKNLKVAIILFVFLQLIFLLKITFWGSMSIPLYPNLTQSPDAVCPGKVVSLGKGVFYSWNWP